MRLLVIIMGCSLVMGCADPSLVSGPVDSDCFHTYFAEKGVLQGDYCENEVMQRTYKEKNFSVQVPGEVFRTSNSKGGTAFIAKEDGLPNGKMLYSIDIESDYAGQCISDELGASKLQEINSGVWTGDVDYFDIYYTMDFPEKFAKRVANESTRFVCRPSSDKRADILCGTKDEKTVVVCVRQAKDSPELAEEIFSTFRWTE